MGVRLALDDFGTGHSSLAYLQRLPLDTLKIDRSFFQDTPQNRAIVSALTTLAHGLGLDITAEGLEPADQVAWARAAGGDRGQGYYFARPLPPEEIAALWAAGRPFDVPGTAGVDEATPPRSACLDSPGRRAKTPRPAPALTNRATVPVSRAGHDACCC